MSADDGTNSVDRTITYSALTDDMLNQLEDVGIDDITATGWQLVKHNVVIEVEPSPGGQYAIIDPRTKNLLAYRETFVTAVLDAAKLLDKLAEAARLRKEADALHNRAINALTTR
jgi:hypothetical protein